MLGDILKGSPDAFVPYSGARPWLESARGPGPGPEVIQPHDSTGALSASKCLDRFAPSGGKLLATAFRGHSIGNMCDT